MVVEDTHELPIAFDPQPLCSGEVLQRAVSRWRWTGTGRARASSARAVFGIVGKQSPERPRGRRIGILVVQDRAQRPPAVLPGGIYREGLSVE